MRLMIGERFNMERKFRWDEYASGQPERWLLVALRMGAFLRDPALGRLNGVNVHWDAGLNLLPPAPQGVKWDAGLAKQVASTAWTLLPKYRVVYLCGRNVQLAFGLGDGKALPGGRWAPCPSPGTWRVLDCTERASTEAVCVPHPSGLCRWWNNVTDVELLKQELADWYGTEYSPERRLEDASW